MSNVIALVSCSKAKIEGKHPAWKLYSSTLFEKSWTAAILMGRPFVLSAKHGLLKPTERIEEYDESMKSSTKIESLQWADEVWSSIPEMEETLIVILAGRDYTTPLMESYRPQQKEFEWISDIKTPYDITRGNGEQMSLAGNISEDLIRGQDVSSAISNSVEKIKRKHDQSI